MKHLQVIAGILFILFLFTITACGGGGGTNGSNGSTGGFASIRMEAVIDGSSPTTTVDPTNIFVNEIVRFRLTGVDDTSTRVIIPTSGYTLTGAPGGALDSTGLFTASSSGTGSSGAVHVTFDATNYSLTVKVVTPDAILKGTGRTTEGFPAAGVQIKALNVSGTVVGTGFIATDGTIRMSVPTSAVKFTTDFSTADPQAKYYVRQFAYSGKDYSTTIVTCTAPLPALTSGLTSNLSTALAFYRLTSGIPPPPPNGCQ